MKIGLLTPYYPDKQTQNSGIANHINILANALEKLGHSVVIIYIKPALDNEQQGYEIKNLTSQTVLLTYKITLPLWFKSIFKKRWTLLEFCLRLKSMLFVNQIINKLINNHKIDIIETSSYFSLSYFINEEKIGIPIIYRVSTTFSQMMTSYYGFNSRLLKFIGYLEIDLIKKAKFLITHARDHAVQLMKQYSIDETKFTIIPHGINLPNLSKENPIDIFTILYVGRMEFRKGTDILLSAIPIVLNKYPKVKFNLVGEDKNEYENNFRKLNSEAINCQVDFNGQTDTTQLQEFYANCTLFVAPSRYESFGLVFIEAMSYGKPVIGFKVGGIPEIIKNYKNGLFAEIDNPIDLAEKIIFFIQNNYERKIMGKNARQTVIDKFTSEILAESSIKYYKYAINKKKSA